MKRNMMKIAGTDYSGVPELYQMTTDEVDALAKMLFEGDDPRRRFWDVSGILFRYGFQLGRRCEKRHGRKLPVVKGFKKKVTEQIGGMTDRQAELVYHFMKGLSGKPADETKGAE